MQRSLANFIAVIGLAIYWLAHAIAIMAAMFPFAALAMNYGVLAKESHELPIFGIFTAPVLLLLDFGDVLSASMDLMFTCGGLLLAAGLLGAITGAVIRLTDPYSDVPLNYVVKRSCVIALLSGLAIALLYPRFASSYLFVLVPSLAIMPVTFWGFLRTTAYPNEKAAEGNREV